MSSWRLGVGTPLGSEFLQPYKTSKQHPLLIKLPRLSLNSNSSDVIRFTQQWRGSLLFIRMNSFVGSRDLTHSQLDFSLSNWFNL